MFRDAIRNMLLNYIENPVTALLAKLGVSPNAVTVSGHLMAWVCAYLLSQGLLAAGGIVLLLSGVFDLFDGALARATGRVTRFGSLLDSVSDRLSEIVVLLGLLLFYVTQVTNSAFEWGIILIYFVLAGSIMVSYVRAKAEGLKIKCEVGVMTRPERIGLMATALIVGQWWLSAVTIILGVIAILAFFTILHRMLYVKNEIARADQ